MPTSKNLLLYALALVVIAFVVSGIPRVTLELLSDDHDHDDPIALGTNIWAGYEPLYLARKTGLLADSDARLLEFSSSTQVMRAFANGTIDAATLTLDEVLSLRDAGIVVVVILVLDMSSGGDAIVAHPEFSKIESLRGQRIAVESTALGALMLSRALAKNGLRLTDVEVVSVEIDEQELFLSRGDVDAAVTFSPMLERLKDRGMVEVFSSREIPGEVVDVLVATPHLVEAHSDKLVALAESWFAALDVIDAEPQRAAELMAPRLGVTPSDVLLMFQGLEFPDVAGNLEFLSSESSRIAETARILNQVLVDAGFLDDEVDVESLYSDSIIRVVASQRQGQ
ncbi:MAG: ABC transporter substrate-binding protein [Pseudomonadota bacterium]